MLHGSLSENDSRFWWPEEFENAANPYFENLKHLQNPGHLSLTAPSMLFNLVSVVDWRFATAAKQRQIDIDNVRENARQVMHD